MIRTFSAKIVTTSNSEMQQFIVYFHFPIELMFGISFIVDLLQMDIS